MPMSFSVALFIPLFQTAGFENQHTIPRIDFFLSYLAGIKKFTALAIDKLSS